MSKQINSYQDEGMTMKDVIQYSKLSYATIIRYIRRGNLKVSKQTGRILIRRSNVDNWLNG